MGVERTFSVVFMPDGRPAPYILTDRDLIKFLRLDEQKTDPANTLQNYRDRGQLRGTYIGKHLRYTLPQVIEFLDQKNK
jgi:hypothetical protein